MAAFRVAVITKEVFVEIELLKKHGFSLRQIVGSAALSNHHKKIFNEINVIL
ncbi:hypothetical protein IWX87_003445 [Polaromonas sp. CG_9.7]|nr:hypothetical protein [Polaromonas sp. CG_9.7]MBG6115666.1 hypothetical protein [Polaromonas sp. CG_9.2]MDH6186610.1 hypothetical protein [Polaromonas sp. CG_23.6]